MGHIEMFISNHKQVIRDDCQKRPMQNGRERSESEKERQRKNDGEKTLAPFVDLRATKKAARNPTLRMPFTILIPPPPFHQYT